MAQFEDVNNLLFKLSYLGTAEAKFTKAILIGKDPNPLYEGAWLNCIYPHISSVEIGLIEDAIKKNGTHFICPISHRILKRLKHFG